MSWMKPPGSIGHGGGDAPNDGNEYIRKNNGWVQLVAGGSGIPSNPTTGNYRVTNLYVNASNGRLVVEYDDTPEP